MAENNKKNCCQKEVKNKPESAKKGFLSGILYGLIPHTFCIAFIVLSVIGATAGTLLFQKILMIPYFFQFLILFSFIAATISALFYLRRNGLLSWQGIKRKWKYLTVLYGTTLAVNLLFFLVVFPALANINLTPKTVSSATDSQSSAASLVIAVDIPCSGHAPIIIGELKKIIGVKDVKFKLPNLFEINYDSNQTSLIAILSLNIFQTFKATLK